MHREACSMFVMVLLAHGPRALASNQGLSPETLDMAYMMVQQFVSFMVDAGYDGEAA